MRHLKTTLIAAGVLGLTAAPAAAAVVTQALNLRAGPGLDYQVITAMPAGAQVATGGCQGNWCRVNFSGYDGWASASYLANEGTTTTYRVVPSYRWSGPSYSYRYYDRYDPWGYDRYDPWGYDRPFWRGPGIGFRLDL